MRSGLVLFTASVLLATLLAPTALPYSVLSHEAIVDAYWDRRIVPVLLARFPGSTPEQLREAHAYAYGGAIIQDLGFYPHGSKFFSDLTHYVRSGGFVQNLVADSDDLNEYAFALGALSHYVSDNTGHPMGINPSVPMAYPKLGQRFGKMMTYEDNPVAHVKTEFGFDVIEVAKGHFAPEDYHNFIGFKVSKPLLASAFRDTYSLEIRSIFRDLDLSIGSYRYAVSRAIPLAAKLAWAQRENEIQKSDPGATRSKFVYTMSRASYHKEWGNKYERPNTLERFLAFLLRLVPKVGPLRDLAFHLPPAQAEQDFMKSFDASLTRFGPKLDEAQSHTLVLPDLNFDLGEPIKPAAYRLADQTYAELVHRLAQTKFAGLRQGTKASVTRYYAHMGLAFDTRRNEKNWSLLNAELQELKRAPVVPEAQLANRKL
jgi:hypothetical protein